MWPSNCIHGLSTNLGVCGTLSSLQMQRDQSGKTLSKPLSDQIEDGATIQNQVLLVNPAGVTVCCQRKISSEAGKALLWVWIVTLGYSGQGREQPAIRDLYQGNLSDKSLHQILEESDLNHQGSPVFCLAFFTHSKWMPLSYLILYYFFLQRAPAVVKLETPQNLDLPLSSSKLQPYSGFL